MNTRKTAKHFKNWYTNYLARSIAVHHYTVVTEDGYTVYYTIDNAREAKHRFDGALFEILPTETGFGAIVRERG